MTLHSIPQTKIGPDEGWDFEIYSTDPGKQLRALYRMRDEADEAYAFWMDQAAKYTGTIKQGALMNAADASRKSDYATAAINSLGDA